MKKILILLFTLFSILSKARAQNSSLCIEGTPLKSLIESHFIGGRSAYHKLIKNNLSLKSNYIFKDDDYVGLLIKIDKNGNLSSVTVLESISTCIECDEEAVRLLKTVKKWIPACDASKKKCKHIPISIVVFVPFGKSSWIFMD